MNADRPFPFNPCSSVFIGGQSCFGLFGKLLEPAKRPAVRRNRPSQGAHWRLRRIWGNEANSGRFRGCRGWAGGRSRLRRASGGRGLGVTLFFRLAFPLGDAQLLQSAEVAALGSRQPAEDLLGRAPGERVAGRFGLRVLAGEENLDDLGFDAGVAPPVPVGLDEGFNEVVFQWRVGCATWK